MIVYLAIYAILSITALQTTRRNSGIYLFVAAAFLFLFMGFRYETGCDYYGYLHRWEYSPSWSEWPAILLSPEPGFNLILAFLKDKGFGYTSLNVVASGILVCCYVAFARAHRFPSVLLALLFPVIIIQLGMSGIRQAIAGGFLMLAMNAFVSGRKLLTAAWILVGMQFHASVVMFFPIALVAGRGANTPKLIGAFLIGGPLVSVLLADRFETYSDRYIEQIHGVVTSGGAVIRYVLVALPVPLFLMTRRKMKANFPQVYPFLELTVLIIASLAPLVVLSSIALHRINYYLMPASIALLTYVSVFAFKNKQQGHVVALLVYGTYSMLWFLSSRHAQGCYVPYQNVLFM